MATELRSKAGLPRAVVLLASLLALVVVAGGCRPSADEPEDSAPPIDVEPRGEIDPSSDPQAKPRGPELTGIMPGDFPDDVPLYLPASLVDYGEDGSGRWVELLSPDPVSTVRAGLTAKLVAAGWQPGAGAGAYVKGERTVRLTVGAETGGAVYRYIY